MKKKIINSMKVVHDKIVWWSLSFLVTLWAMHMVMNYIGWYIRHPRSKGIGWYIQNAKLYDTIICMFCLSACVYGAWTCGMIFL